MSTKSQAAPGVAPKLMAAVENLTLERKDWSGSDLSCLICDETTKDSLSFDCNQCLHRMQAACAAIDADIVLALQKPSGRFFLFTSEKCSNQGNKTGSKCHSTDVSVQCSSFVISQATQTELEYPRSFYIDGDSYN